MKREAKWADIMKETRQDKADYKLTFIFPIFSWMHFKTVHQNSGWMSDVNKNGQVMLASDWLTQINTDF